RGDEGSRATGARRPDGALGEPATFRRDGRPRQGAVPTAPAQRGRRRRITRLRPRTWGIRPAMLSTLGALLEPVERLNLPLTRLKTVSYFDALLGYPPIKALLPIPILL